MTNVCRILVGRDRLLVHLNVDWRIILKEIFKKIEYEGMYWTKVAQRGFQWRDLVKRAVKPRAI